jgi:hypothetical protein
MPTGVYKRTKKAGMSGKHHTEESNKKNREKHLGKTYSNRKKPVPFSDEHRKNMGISHKGSKSHFWKGGITPKNKLIRYSLSFDIWRETVFLRDRYTCQKYGTTGGELNAHHIKNFSEYPELRFEASNGITLSEKAHREFHKKYGHKNNTLEQLQEFLKINKMKKIQTQKREYVGVKLTSTQEEAVKYFILLSMEPAWTDKVGNPNVALQGAARNLTDGIVANVQKSLIQGHVFAKLIAKTPKKSVKKVVKKGTKPAPKKKIIKKNKK